MGTKDVGDKITEFGAVIFRTTGILELELHGNERHFVLPYHLIRR